MLLYGLGKLEVTACIIGIGYLVSWWTGKSRNYEIARVWTAECRDIFKRNFAQVGMGGAPTIPDGYSTYKLWASGRVNCQSCLATLNLVRRQDAFSRFALNLIWPAVDLVDLEIPLDS